MTCQNLQSKKSRLAPTRSGSVTADPRTERMSSGSSPNKSCGTRINRRRHGRRTIFSYASSANILMIVYPKLDPDEIIKAVGQLAKGRGAAIG
jgi:hypothetical protein